MEMPWRPSRLTSRTSSAPSTRPPPSDYLISGSRDEAEELAHDAFVKALERWDRVREMDNPAGTSIELRPSGWQTRAATESCGHGELAFDALDVDLIFDPTLKDDLYLDLVSEPLGGMSARGWVTAQTFDFGSLGSVWMAEAGARGNGFQGNKAWFWGCRDGRGAGSAVVVATATRGYIIYLHVADDPHLR
jgi:hypothetical protein